MPALTFPVTKIQKFCTHDGPGIRTTVFLKGCPLHCAWCHNPETQSAKPQFFYTAKQCIACRACAAVCPQQVHGFVDGRHTLLRKRCLGCMKCTTACPTGALEACGKDMTVDEVLHTVLQDRAFYASEGGLTLSGGEPMLHPEAVFALLRAARDAGLTTAMETCGYFAESLIPSLAPLVDTFLWDFKDGNAERHEQYTGVSNSRILENLRRLDEFPVRIRLRCILVKGVNLDESNLSAIAAYAGELRHVEGVELLPYHVYGSSKHSQLGEGENGRPEWIPQKADLAAAKKYLKSRGVKVL